jgi:integrase
MGRDKLTALQVKRAHDKGDPVLLADGAGLYLRKQTSAGTTWTFRYRFGGRVESARQRSLSRDELGKLFEAMREAPSFGGTNLLTVKLLLALGVRKGELLRARWSEFDLDGTTDSGPLWRLPASRTKTAATTANAHYMWASIP